MTDKTNANHSISSSPSVIHLLTAALLYLLWSIDTASAQNKYAVIVGVGTYDVGTFENLEFANDDASDLGATLRGLGFQTTVLTSNAKSSTLRPSSPMKIARNLKAVAGSCGPSDTLLVSLSGHGVHFADHPPLPTGVQETFFCPEDADLNDLSSLLKISHVMRFMAESNAGRKLLLVDACRNRVLSNQGRRKSVRRIELGSVHEKRKSVPKGMLVLFSCTSGQFSWEHSDLGHSVFSHHVIDYLGGRADGRRYEDGMADLDGLVASVRQETNDYVIEKNLSPDGQLPVLRGESSNWSFGKVRSSVYTNSIGMEFKLISTPDEPAQKGLREQIDRPFYIGTFEVTQGEFKEIVGKNPAAFSPLGNFADRVTGKQTVRFPVEMISLNDARDFCARLSRLPAERRAGCYYRLPTEKEWRFACLAGANSKYCFGNDVSQLSKYAWYRSNTDPGDNNRTHRVGLLRPNALGLYDVHGNVAEWCESLAPGNDVGVFRGGSWMFNREFCDATRRTSPGDHSVQSNLGFRVIMEFADQVP